MADTEETIKGMTNGIEEPRRTTITTTNNDHAATNGEIVTTNTEEQRIEQMEGIMETNEKQKIDTKESRHMESSIDSSEVVNFENESTPVNHQNNEDSDSKIAEDVKEAKEESLSKTEKESVSENHDETVVVEDSEVVSSTETQKNNLNQSAETEKEADSSEKVSASETAQKESANETVNNSEISENPQNNPDVSESEVLNSAEITEALNSAEISEQGIKNQLEEIIKEIEENVVNEDNNEKEDEEDNKQGREEETEGNGEDQVYHTWKPKGKYELEHTVVEHPDVVPISVSAVPEHVPIVVPVKESKPVVPTPEKKQKKQQQHPQEEVVQIIAPQLMPNGELGPPMPIPEGIPLLARVLPQEEDSHRQKIPLERLFTPATDSGEITPKKKKAAFASSDFYGPDHPTIDDQLQLAQKISESLVDQTNNSSRGQAMYEKRKQRSQKWVHQEGDKISESEFQEEEYEEATGSNSMMPMDLQQMDHPQMNKPALKLVMNPKGVHDHTTVEQHYQQLLEQSNTTASSAHGTPGQMPASPEIVKDIMNDMQSPTGKGAALFAKRKKRMDKFIVDETNVQKSSAYQQEQQSFVQQNSSVSKTTTSNEISSSSSSFSSSTKTQQQQAQQKALAAGPAPAAPGSKKRWLQEKDKEQKQIMEDFMKNREQQVKMVKSPWESVLETGNTSSAFQEVQQTKRSFSSSISSSSVTTAEGASNVSSWLDMPKPVPVAEPMPLPVIGQQASASAPAPTSSFTPSSGQFLNGATPPAAFIPKASGITPSPMVAQTPVAPNPLGGTSSLGGGGVAVAGPTASAFTATQNMATNQTAFAQTTTSNVSSSSIGFAAQTNNSTNAPLSSGPSAPHGGGGGGLNNFSTGGLAPPTNAVNSFTPNAVSPSGGQTNNSFALSQAEMEERRKSMNFNLAATGWGSYNKYYRPTSFAS